MLPQEGKGGCAPKPKKLSPASNKIAEAKLAEATTAKDLGNLAINDV